MGERLYKPSRSQTIRRLLLSPSTRLDLQRMRKKTNLPPSNNGEELVKRCTTCQTFTTEDGRHKIKQIANRKPILYALTPFGLDPQIQTPQKQIVRAPEYANEYSITRINNSVHGKLLLTRDYAIHGSCNFTENSIQNQHEIIHVTCRNCDPERYETMKRFFDQLWKRSTKTRNSEISTQKTEVIH